MSIQSLIPKYICDIAPYQGGKPISELAREYHLEEASIVKLASNENPLGMSPMARAVILKSIDDIARYPDGNAFKLKSAVSHKFELNPEGLIFGNGSNDILELAARTFLKVGDEVIFSQHAFAVYALVTQVMGAIGIKVPARDFSHDLSGMLKAITHKTKIIFIANPNNPTGTLISKNELKAFLNEVPQNIIVVLDEAYDEYLNHENKSESFLWLSEFSNLIVSRTFSKAYGLAGLRVGFGASNPEIIQFMNRVRQPFNVNSLAQDAAIAALMDDAFVSESKILNNDGKKQLESAFQRLKLSYIPTFGNFISFKVNKALQVYEALLKAGIIVRPVANYEMPDYLRVSIGLKEENERFIKVLETII
ncbi:MAG: histidinol-phosphate transaminase [Candidatus Methylopumilus sp.]|nr:histidinol-phosphate transaminase [Candidatus Methylopumilus sp.]